MRFDIPEILSFNGNSLIRLQSMPIRVSKELELHPEHYAICFVVSKDYFRYLNETLAERRLSEDEADLEFKDTILRCAYLFGALASLGIIHTDLIPLFHNRIEVQERQDNGAYLWWLLGRVNNWLHSCD